MVAEIIINSIAKDLNKIFDYIIPTNIEKELKIGARVFVPFGRIKKEEGFVIRIKQSSRFATREILSIEDNNLTEENIELAKLMSRRYFCNISDCINLMLPPGDKSKKYDNRIKHKTGRFVKLNKTIEEIKQDIESKLIKSEKQIKVLNFLTDNDNIYIPDLQGFLDVSLDIIKRLEKNNYIKIIEEKIDRNPFINKKIEKDKPLKLTEEQQKAYERMNINCFKEFLLQGITGSRKNRNLFTINTEKN